MQLELFAEPSEGPGTRVFRNGAGDFRLARKLGVMRHLKFAVLWTKAEVEVSILRASGIEEARPAGSHSGGPLFFRRHNAAGRRNGQRQGKGGRGQGKARPKAWGRTPRGAAEPGTAKGMRRPRRRQARLEGRQAPKDAGRMPGLAPVPGEACTRSAYLAQAIFFG